MTRKYKHSVKYLTKKSADELGSAFGAFYDRQVLSVLESGTSVSSLLYGDIIGYRKKKVTKYLYIPIPTIERQYNDDSEYGTGEFEGFLISVRWINTHIPIGKETIEVLVYRKAKGQTIKFRRYGKLDSKQRG